VDSVLSARRWQSVVIQRLINYHAGRIVNLPPAAINVDNASLIEVEVDVMQSETNLANRIADKSLEWKVF
jgi:hypothetical protein